MKKIIIIAAFLLFIPSAVYGSVSCSTCDTNSCNCTVSDCSSGKLLIYPTNTCSGPPSDNPYITSGSATWYPSSTGTFYAKPFCDNTSIVTSCSSVSVSSAPTTSTTTATTSGTTTATTSGGGGGGGGGISCRPLGNVCTAFSICCPGLQCVNGICQAPLIVTTTTTSTPTPTTTTISKQDCQFDCCQNEDSFFDKSCSDGFECVANNCQEISTTTPQETGNEFPWGLILAIVLIVVLIPLFVFFFIFKRKKDDWKKLYDKWKRPKYRVYQKV
ncbi:MAG: hypothetical protein J4452_01270 [Candidatus Aenigmarchaeota archaeon]|nr:hypothetical protein [Candidatus Aenigmarchaeota archaeon]